MALPSLIEIVPLDQPVRAEITMPGSKSITNRALILAALAEGETILTGALWSEDTQVMVECLQELGFMVNIEPDPHETCNRTITVYGEGGRVPPGGTADQPKELYVGNAGTAARFLAALVCLGKGIYRLHGVPRMHERPQAALFKALRELGYRVETEQGNDRLPVLIQGAGQKVGAKCKVSIEQSSQFASALLLCARYGGWHIKITGENAEESPYVAMTVKLIEAFPHRRGRFQIEPDASSGSYFWGAAWLFERAGFSNEMMVYDWPRTESRWQVDAQFRMYIGLGLDVGMKNVISRLNELADSIMTAIVLAPLAGQPVKFIHLGRLRVQETERVVALRTELTRCGAKVVEEGDTLTVYPSQLHGAEIETYEDHRLAMCFAILGLKVPGIKIKNPACVKKTFPNFFQKLAGPPPNGLGATILDARTGQKLEFDDLFAG
ncbi:MAG: 3-phosphoshikimate 1-carboxyvinyltransferase [Verrucomicrobiia bacterium]